MDTEAYLRRIGSFIWSCLAWNYKKTDLSHYPSRERLTFWKRYRWHVYLNNIRKRDTGKRVPFMFFIKEA